MHRRAHSHSGTYTCPRCKKRPQWLYRNNHEGLCKRCYHKQWGAEHKSLRDARKAARRETVDVVMEHWRQFGDGTPQSLIASSVLYCADLPHKDRTAVRMTCFQKAGFPLEALRTTPSKRQKRRQVRAAADADAAQQEGT
jgi:hypothetical protein